MLSLFLSLAFSLPFSLSCFFFSMCVSVAQLLMWLARYCFFFFRKNEDPFPPSSYTHFHARCSINFLSGMHSRRALVARHKPHTTQQRAPLDWTLWLRAFLIFFLQNCKTIDRINQTHLAKFVSFHYFHDLFESRRIQRNPARSIELFEFVRSENDFRIGSTETWRREVTGSYVIRFDLNFP